MTTRLCLDICGSENHSTYPLQCGLNGPWSPLNSGPADRNLSHPASLFQCSVARLCFLVSSRTPLSSGCENVVSTLALVPHGAFLNKCTSSWCLTFWICRWILFARICSTFVTYVHQWYCPVVFFFGGISGWFLGLGWWGPHKMSLGV